MPAWMLPVLPPSTNHLFYTDRTRGTRHKTRIYREWRSVCATFLRLNGARMLPPGPVAVDVQVQGGKGWNPRRDADNILKSCLDLLCHAGVLDTDCSARVQDVRVRYLAPPQAGALASCIVSVHLIPSV